jgi:sensor c-di-GMP phosphodiesterase-like protein
MSNPSELFLFYVTNTDATGKVTHTWMANHVNGGYTWFHSPSWKEFRYYTKEQAKTLKKELDKYQKLLKKNGSTYKSEYKIMSLKAAVNFHIKRMRELMENREAVNYSGYLSTKQKISADIAREERGDKTIPINIFR